MFSLLIFLTGCTDERVVDLPLDDGSGKIVIEGNVTDANGPYFVKVTRSGKVTGSNNIIPVSNATVVISDNNGQTDILKYEDGAYHTVHFTTSYGNTYTLSVTVDGTTYKAVSKMPEQVPFTGLVQKNVSNEYYISKDIIPVFTDPAAEGNHYLFKAYRGDYPVIMTLFSDYTGNGQVNVKPLGGNFFGKVEVEMQCVDAAVYNYFKALPQVNLDNSGGDITHVNPPSNISNGALGYFSAHTSSVKSIVIQE